MNDEDLFITIRDPDGNPVRIAKNGLSPEARAQYGALAPPEPNPEAALPVQPSSDLRLASQSLTRQPQAQSMSVESPSFSAPASSTPMSPSSMSNASLIDRGYDAQRSAIDSSVQSQERLGQRQANAFDQAARIQQQEIEAQQKALAEKQEFQRQSEAEMADLDKKVADFKPQDYWADKSTGHRIAAAIAIGMGAYAAAINGGPNTAMQIINDSIDRDMRKQEFEFNKLKDQRGAKQNQFAQRMQMFGDADLARKSMLSSGLEMTKMQLEKYASLAGSEVAKANALKMVGELDVKQGELRADIAAKMAEKKQKANQDQAKAGGFARRLEQSEGVFDKLAAEGYDRSDISAGVGSALPNVVRSSESQMQEQAERNFINAVLRRESGAAIAESEFENAELQYFPRAGDSAKVAEQKRRNRLQALESLKSEGGVAYDDTPLVSAGEILVKDPKGRVGKIPQENLRRAMERGYSLVE